MRNGAGGAQILGHMEEQGRGERGHALSAQFLVRKMYIIK